MTPTIINEWVTNLAIGFAMRQLEKFGDKTNWTTVKADFAVRVAQIVPGTWLDAEAVELSNEVIDAIARAFDNTKTLGLILKLVTNGKHAEAAAKLRDYLLKCWKPETAVAEKARSLVEGSLAA